jgi:hypothetical protein
LSEIDFTSEVVFIEHVALKKAPASTISLDIITSPSVLLEVFRVNVSFTSKLPENTPSKSAFLQMTLPFILPSFPITTLPEVEIEPSNTPSILKSDSD